MNINIELATADLVSLIHQGRLDRADANLADDIRGVLIRNACLAAPNEPASAWPERLAAKWEIEGSDLIQRASIAPSRITAIELMNEGSTARRCASELRAESARL